MSELNSMTGRIVYSPDFESDPIGHLARTQRTLASEPEAFPLDWNAAWPFPKPEEAASEGEKINISILALDLGTKPGFAVRRRDGRIIHGSADFTPRASWGPGQKWQRWRAWLSGLVVGHNVGQIAFEDVKRHAMGAVLAAHAYGGYRAMMEMVADQHNIPLRAYGVGQVKQFWTGNGAATKELMMVQAKARGYRVSDDNDADALAILHLDLAHEAGTWQPAAKKSKPKTMRAPKAQGVLV